MYFLHCLVKKHEQYFNIDYHIDPECDNFRESQLKSISTKVLNPILTDFDNNLSRLKYRREFSSETKLYSYTIYPISSAAYRVPRDQMPLPS